MQMQTVGVQPTQMSVQTCSLVALDGPLSGQRFVISGRTEVGREGGGIPLSFDGGVSRKHVCFSPEANGIGVQERHGAACWALVCRDAFAADQITIGKRILDMDHADN